jgi:aminopeptidase C
MGKSFCQCEETMVRLHSCGLVPKSQSSREKKHVKSKEFYHLQSCHLCQVFKLLRDVTSEKSVLQVLVEKSKRNK